MIDRQLVLPHGGVLLARWEEPVAGLHGHTPLGQLTGNHQRLLLRAVGVLGDSLGGVRHGHLLGGEGLGDMAPIYAQ